MKQGRTPDRVHVVRKPEEARGDAPGMMTPTAPGAPESRGMEIIRTLAAISDKLKRSEAERYELLAELRAYKKTLNDLEDKTEKTASAYLSLENKLKVREGADDDVTQRQARFERALKETADRLVQASAGQNLIASRLKDTEEKQAGLILRVDETANQQTRLDRQLEKIGQDKTRMLRKVERMEEILTETQDTLKARALVLLTDQSAAAQGAGFPQISAYGETPESRDMPWWRRSVRMQGVGMASMVVAALLFGWTINQLQQPDMPKIAVLENGDVARLNTESNQWEALNRQQNTAQEPTLTPVQTTQDMPLAESTQTPAAQAALNASDEELMAALEENPDQLAAQLNEIAPEVGKALDLEETPDTIEQTAIAPPSAKTNYNPLMPFEGRAFRQDPQVANRIAKGRNDAPIASRATPDSSLPAALQNLETQALAGVPEAQHDLAAIYTAGRAGVTQNFEKAAFWFREASDSKIANAAYNLGVLHHQGLGVERDLDAALYWYREAAKLGHPEAQYNLGIAHIEGIGTGYDAPLASAFFESAANQGIVEAAYNLGLIYENGLLDGGIKTEEAMLWYKIASDGGSTDAKAALTQLASSLQIGMEDVDKMVERLQSIYVSAHGRRAGPNTTSASQATNAIPSQKALVAQIQEALKAQGFYKGTADGMTGPNTVEAIRQYESRNGLKVTGLATQDLLARMLSDE